MSLYAYDAVQMLATAMSQQLKGDDGGRGFFERPNGQPNRMYRERVMRGLRRTNLVNKATGNIRFNDGSNDRAAESFNWEVKNFEVDHSASDTATSVLRFKQTGEFRDSAYIAAPAVTTICSGTTAEIAVNSTIRWPGNTYDRPVALNPALIPSVVKIAYIASASEGQDFKFVQQAVNEVNQNRFLLPRSHLQLVTATVSSTSGEATEYMNIANQMIDDATASGYPISAFMIYASHPSKKFQTYISGPRNMPYVGIFSTSPALSNTTQYPLFTRVIQSDVTNAQAVATMMLSNNWRKVAVILQDTGDSWAVDYKNITLEKARGAGIEVGEFEWGSPPSSDEAVRQAFYTAEAERVFREASEFKIFILVETSKTFAAGWQAAYRLNMLEGYQYIVPEISPEKSRVHKTLDGRYCPPGQNDTSSCMFNVLPLIDGLIGIDIGNYDQTTAQFAKSRALYESNASLTKPFMEHDGIETRRYDTILMLADAMHRCIITGRNAQGDYLSSGVYNGQELVSFIRSTTVRGISGPLQLDTGSNDRKDDLYKLGNVQYGFRDLTTVSSATGTLGCRCLSESLVRSRMANVVEIFRGFRTRNMANGGTNASYIYPFTYGVNCHQHDLSLQPYCADSAGQLLATAPSWCQDRFCFVDSTACSLGNSPSNFFPGADISYSYVTCGSSSNFDTFFGAAGGTSGGDNSAAVADMVEDAFETAGSITGQRTIINICQMSRVETRVGASCEYTSPEYEVQLVPNGNGGVVITWILRNAIPCVGQSEGSSCTFQPTKGPRSGEGNPGLCRRLERPQGEWAGTQVNLYCDIVVSGNADLELYTMPPEDFLMGFRISVTDKGGEALAWPELANDVSVGVNSILLTPTSTGDSSLGLVTNIDYLFSGAAVYGSVTRGLGLATDPVYFCMPRTGIDPLTGQTVLQACGTPVYRYLNYGSPPAGPVRTAKGTGENLTSLGATLHERATQVALEKWFDVQRTWDATPRCPNPGSTCLGRSWPDLATPKGYWRSSNVTIPVKFIQCRGKKEKPSPCGGPADIWDPTPTDAHPNGQYVQAASMPSFYTMSGSVADYLATRGAPTDFSGCLDGTNSRFDNDTCFCYPSFDGTSTRTCVMTNPTPCFAGHTGFKCAACEWDHYQDGGFCHKCMFGMADGWALLVGVLIGIVALLLLVWFLVARYATSPKIEKELISVLKHIDTEFGVEGIEQVFKDFDASGDGSLDPEEFEAALQKLGIHTAGDPVVQKQVRKIVKKMDADGDGKITAEEFVRFTRGVKKGKKSINKCKGCVMGILAWWKAPKTKTVKIVITGYLQVIGTLQANFPEVYEALPNEASTNFTELAELEQQNSVAVGGNLTLNSANATGFAVDESASRFQALGNAAISGLNAVAASASLPPGLADFIQDANDVFAKVALVLAEIDMSMVSFVNCVLGPRYYYQLIYMTGIPLGIVFFIWSLPRIMEFFVTCRCCAKRFGAARLMHAKHTVDGLKPQALSINFLIIFLLYPAIARRVIRSFVCEKFQINDNEDDDQ